MHIDLFYFTLFFMVNGKGDWITKYKFDRCRIRWKKLVYARKNDMNKEKKLPAYVSQREISNFAFINKEKLFVLNVPYGPLINIYLYMRANRAYGPKISVNFCLLKKGIISQLQEPTKRPLISHTSPLMSLQWMEKSNLKICGKKYLLCLWKMGKKTQYSIRFKRDMAF